MRDQTRDQLEDDEPIADSILGWSALEWLEWQANKLAGIILMPASAILLAIEKVQNQEGIVRQRGRIFQNHSQQGKLEASRHLALVANEFQVSKTVAKIRLSDLQLFEIQPSPPKPNPLEGITFRG